MNDVEFLCDLERKIRQYHGLVALTDRDGRQLREIASRIERMRDLLTSATTVRETDD